MIAYRIVLECGDTSTLRAKKTPEGYTHDWEVWIKGVDNAPIHHYIEKVVFNLHPSFHKTKRVVKEPPYILKESGYAGFDIPINVYLKNKNEPKRFDILYNLNLETNTPTISHHSRHVEIIVNPSEEFRKKLLKGGASPTNADNSQLEKSETKTLMMVGKPKLSGNSELKKHRIVEPKVSNQFNDLFGPPIKTAKLMQETKKTSEKSSSLKIPVALEKSDKIDKSTKAKYSPHKDSKKEKSSEERKEKREKEKDGNKDKEKSKDKFKRSLSPSSSKVNHQSNDKRSSPTSIKKSSSPNSAPKRLSSPSSKSKEKESKKDLEKEKDKDREKEKSKDSLKGTSDEVKSEKNEKDRKKEKKKHKEDRDKEKKDKHRDKERERSKDKDRGKSVEKNVEKSEKIEKDKLEVKQIKEERKSPKTFKETEVKVKEEKISKPEKSEKVEKEKVKEPKGEKIEQKSKHKHKKKDKKEKRDGSREREKKEKREKAKSTSEHKNEVTNHVTTPTPVTTRVSEIVDRDSSDSSGDEDSIVESRLSGGSGSKKEVPIPIPTAEVHRSMSPPPAPVGDKKDKSERKRDRSKSRREEKESKKRKRKSESKCLGDDEISPAKKVKDRDNSTSPPVEPVSSSQSPIAANADLLHVKVKHEPEDVVEPTNGSPSSGQVAPDSTNSTFVETEDPLVFSEDYVLQLKDLQQKIMMLQDNQELQRVVQVIAETGQYEITKKTFDFDLCALDRRTVQRLQQFFAS